MQQNLSVNVGETEQDLLRHSLYACAFVHCAHWLVKSTLRMVIICCPKTYGDKAGLLLATVAGIFLLHNDTIMLLCS
jgi:hypothetical protein